MDNVDRITLIKGNDLAHFYYRKGDATDRARATAAAEDWAKNDGKAADGRSSLTLEAQTEEDLRVKTEREDAAAKQAAADKAAEQERLRREAEARDNKARADATVDDFQLGQTAEQQMSGMDDLFGGNAERDTEQEYQDLKAEADKWLGRDAEYEGRDFAGEYAAARNLDGQEFIEAVTPILEDFKDARARFFAPNRDAIERMQQNERSMRANLPQQTEAESAFDASPERAIQAMTAEQRESMANELGIRRGKKTEVAFIEALAEGPIDKVRGAYLAATQSSTSSGLEDIFDGLQSRGLKKKNATEAAKAHPLAERIALVDKHILDILSDLDDSGTIKINC